MTKPTLTVTSSNSSTITLHFSQAMQSGYGDIVISDGSSQTYLSGGQLASRIVGDTDSRVLGAGDNQISYNGQDVVIHLDSPLKAGLTYSVTMASGALIYDEEHAFDAVSSTKVFNFTTSGGAIATPSAVVGSAIHFIDNGASNSDYITSISTQTVTGTITGTLGANDFVQVSVDNGATWGKATVSGNTWSYHGEIDPDNLVDVSGGQGGALLARVSNLDGKSTAQSGHSYVYNGGATADTAVLTGRALALAASSDSGASSSDGITTSATAVTLNVAGLHGFHAGDTIQILDTSNASAIVASYVIQQSDLAYGGSNGGDYLSINPNNPTPRNSFDVTLTNPLLKGSHGLVARMIDKNGIVSTAASDLGTVVVDQTAPQMSGSSPSANAPTVDVGLTKLEFTFNEDIAIDSNSVITITNLDNPNLTRQISLSSDSVLGNKLTVNLNEALAASTHYEVGGLIIRDIAGNVGVTGDTPLLQFTTEAATPNVPDVPATPTLIFNDSAPASDDDSGSTFHTDGITHNSTVIVSGLTSSEWYYRLGPLDNWHQGSGDTFELEETLLGVPYAAHQIEVKQVVDGVTSDVGSNSQPITLDTTGPTAQILASARSSFANSDTELHGETALSTILSNEIVEVSFNDGADWVAATSSFKGIGASNWSIAHELGDTVSVRVVDEAGNIGEWGTYGQHALTFLASGGASYTADGVAIVFGDTGSGNDNITVGNGSYVSSGDGNDQVTTGNSTHVQAGNGNNTIVTGTSSSVITGNGNNHITVGAGSTVFAGSGNDHIIATDGADDIVAGAGNDVIEVGLNWNTGIAGGAGNDTLSLRSASTISLASLPVVHNIIGIDTLNLQGNTTLSILEGIAVGLLTDSGTLTIDGDSSNHVQLNTLLWLSGGVVGDYHQYHTLTGAVILIAQTLTVDLPA